MLVVRSVRFRSLALMLGSSVLLAGCASLPASGPTVGEIQKGAESTHNEIGFKILDVNVAVVNRLETNAAAYAAQAPTLVSLAANGDNDVVGPGDILTVSIYEVGVSLFGGQRGATEPGAFDPSARAENFPIVGVDRDGYISLPYVGKLAVAGQTVPEIQAMISRAYHGKSQDPQVLVALKNNVAETVYVSGEVRKPGMIELTLKRERLLDAIASAGGINTAPEDTVIRFTRGGRVIEERFDHIRTSVADDLLMIPGDRIEIIKRPRTFLVLGATSKVSQIPFETSDVSVAEALARVGGPNDSQANPAGVFLFRYEKQVGQTTTIPVVYRLNMLQPQSYFLAQRFAVQDKDVIYIANAATLRPSKFVSILNQLFSPFVSARIATQ